MTYEKEVKHYRDIIDSINNEIITLISERQKAALAIGNIKKKYGKPIVDKSREKVILKKIKEKAPLRNLDPGALERIFKEIINLCVEAEERQ